MPRYNATWHWAKIEPPAGPDAAAALAAMRARLAARFDLRAFNAARARLDPDNILGSALLDEVLGTPGGASDASGSSGASEAAAVAAARAG
jgi:L-galactono-1,4-lactone dehydrogenase